MGGLVAVIERLVGWALSERLLWMVAKVVDIEHT